MVLRHGRRRRASAALYRCDSARPLGAAGRRPDRAQRPGLQPRRPHHVPVGLASRACSAIWAFDYDTETGTPADRRLFVDMKPPARPPRRRRGGRRRLLLDLRQRRRPGAPLHARRPARPLARAAGEEAGDVRLRRPGAGHPVRHLHPPRRASTCRTSRWPAACSPCGPACAACAETPSLPLNQPTPEEDNMKLETAPCRARRWPPLALGRAGHRIPLGRHPQQRRLPDRRRRQAHERAARASAAAASTRSRCSTRARWAARRKRIDQVKIGALDLTRVNISPMNCDLRRRRMVPTMPFLFSSIEHMRKVARRPGRRRDPRRAASRTASSAWPSTTSGARSIYAKKPIKTVADAKGMKIRVQQSDLWVALVSAMGANATPMPIGEVYTGLKTGLIDAAENNIPSFDGFKHFEAVKFYSKTEHSMAPEMLVMSQGHLRQAAQGRAGHDPRSGQGIGGVPAPEVGRAGSQVARQRQGRRRRRSSRSTRSRSRR